MRFQTLTGKKYIPTKRYSSLPKEDGWHEQIYFSQDPEKPKYEKRYLNFKNALQEDEDHNVEEILLEKDVPQKKEACFKALRKILCDDVALVISNLVTDYRVSSKLFDYDSAQKIPYIDMHKHRDLLVLGFLTKEEIPKNGLIFKKLLSLPNPLGEGTVLYHRLLYPMHSSDLRFFEPRIIAVCHPFKTKKLVRDYGSHVGVKGSFFLDVKRVYSDGKVTFVGGRSDYKGEIGFWGF